MARREPTSFDPGEPLEPGPELDARIALIEQRVREQMALVGEPAGADTPAPVPVNGRDVLLLIACVRELLRDREALLEELEALERGAAAR